jgi:hypothetical protein
LADNRGLRGRLTLHRLLKCGARKPIRQCRAQHARSPFPASFRVFGQAPANAKPGPVF